jgi:PTS system glucose-specific IIA component
MGSIFKKDKIIRLKAPLTGEMVRLTNVPDEVFSNKAVGAGLALKPETEEVVSPGIGIVKRLFPTKHAIGIVIEGVEILIHVGINTVELEGQGFNYLVTEGTKVKAGDKLMEFDLEYIKNNSVSILTPVVIPNKKAVKEIKFADFKRVTAGEDMIFEVVLF